MEKFSFKLYREHGAMNSPPIFDAVEEGLVRIGHKIDSDTGQIPVIWSVLWQGRMEKNKQVYLQTRSKNLPVLIIEVGNLQRNKTWRISLNNINGQGFFGNDSDLDTSRHQKFKSILREYQKNRRSEILITTQHEHSLQWQNMPKLESWISETINKIRGYSDRKIILRPHPRWNRSTNLGSLKNLEIQHPRKITGTYDDFDIDYNYHCIINHNSGPAVQAALSGVPVICDVSSLAYPISNHLSNLENLEYVDRDHWFLKLCHTEWSVDEIRQGTPFLRLHSEIEKFFL
jgi:hypothetical protein